MKHSGDLDASRLDSIHPRLQSLDRLYNLLTESPGDEPRTWSLNISGKDFAVNAAGATPVMDQEMSHF